MSKAARLRPLRLLIGRDRRPRMRIRPLPTLRDQRSRQPAIESQWPSQGIMIPLPVEHNEASRFAATTGSTVQLHGMQLFDATKVILISRSGSFARNPIR